MYYIRFQYQNYFGIEGVTTEQEAEKEGRKLLAKLILNGIISVEVVQRDPVPEIKG